MRLHAAVMYGNQPGCLSMRHLTVFRSHTGRVRMPLHPTHQSFQVCRDFRQTNIQAGAVPIGRIGTHSRSQHPGRCAANDSAVWRWGRCRLRKGCHPSRRTSQRHSNDQWIAGTTLFRLCGSGMSIHPRCRQRSSFHHGQKMCNQNQDFHRNQTPAIPVWPDQWRDLQLHCADIHHRFHR